MLLILHLFAFKKNDTKEIIQNTSHLLLCMHNYEQNALVIDCNENI